MAMYAKQKGPKAVSPTAGRSGNHTKGMDAPTPKKEIGKGLPNTYFGNSKNAVDKKFDRHGHD